MHVSVYAPAEVTKGSNLLYSMGTRSQECHFYFRYFGGSKLSMTRHFFGITQTRHGTARHSLAQHGPGTARQFFGTARIWYVWHGTALARHGTDDSGTARFQRARHGMARGMPAIRAYSMFINTHLLLIRAYSSSHCAYCYPARGQAGPGKR